MRTHTRVVASVVLLGESSKFRGPRGGQGGGGLLEAVERAREHLRVHVSQREGEGRKGLERRNTVATTLSVGSRWAGEQQVVA